MLFMLSLKEDDAMVARSSCAFVLEQRSLFEGSLSSSWICVAKVVWSMTAAYSPVGRVSCGLCSVVGADGRKGRKRGRALGWLC